MNVIALVQYRYRTLQHMDTTFDAHYRYKTLQHMDTTADGTTDTEYYCTWTPHPMDVIAREHGYHRQKMLPLQNITTN